jgi:sulfur-oxidizing protein SoxZ
MSDTPRDSARDNARDSARVIIDMPATAKAGEVISIRAMIGHDMETGYRRGSDGNMLGRNLLRRFTCTAGEQVIFSAQFHAAMAANPFVNFRYQAQQSVSLQFEWNGDQGFRARREQRLSVS